MINNLGGSINKLDFLSAKDTQGSDLLKSTQNKKQSNSKDNVFEKTLENAEKKRAPLKSTSPQPHQTEHENIDKDQNPIKDKPKHQPIESHNVPKKQVKSDVQPSEKVDQPQKLNEKETIIEERLTRGNDDVDPLTKRIAMQKFLKRMKNELGIQPEEVVLAFTKLDSQTLMLPPEQSLDQLVQQLDLSPEQTVVAKSYFQEMLQQTASSSMAQYMKGTGKDLSLEILSKDQIRRKHLNESLDNMNSRFFVNNMDRRETMNNEYMSQEAAAAGSMLTAENIGKGSQTGQLNSQIQNNNMFPGVNQSIMADGLPTQVEAPLPNTSFDSMNSTQQGMGSADVDLKALSELQNSKNLESDQMKLDQALKQMQQSKQAKSGEVIQDLNVKGDAVSKINVNGLDLPASGPDNLNLQNLTSSNSNSAYADVSGDKSTLMGMATDTGAEAQAEGEGEFTQTDSAFGKLHQTGNSQKAETFSMGKPVVTASDESANVSELVSKAQFMIKKGGGEMKVQLKPEGMGDVTLKVGVNEGVVNVEMLTESNEVKKMLEKGLGDLKATLASHKLNVDMIKVDVSHQMQNEMNQQQEQADRQFAHRFMQEFQNNNQSWRQSFFDVPGARSYGSQMGDHDESVKGLEELSRTKSKADRRLDLVA